MADSQHNEQPATKKRIARDLTGKRFGRLLILRRHENQTGNDISWLAKCDCGNMHRVKSGNIMRPQGDVSCGCWRKETRFTHRQTNSPTHNSWDHMLQRCLNPSNDRYESYGGRGITVCDRWRKYENFRDDMGERPKGTTLDRIDVNGNYEPGNCRWASHGEQSRNTRRSVFIEVYGERMILQDAAAKYGICPKSLGMRIKKGWSVERAIATPVKKRPFRSRKKTAA